MNFLIIFFKTNKTRTKVPDILLHKQLLHILAAMTQQRPLVIGLVCDMFLPLRDREATWCSNLLPTWSVSVMRYWKILHPTDYSCIKETGNNQNYRTFGMSVLSFGVKGWSYCQTRCEEHLNEERMGSWTQVGNIRMVFYRVYWCWRRDIGNIVQHKQGWYYVVDWDYLTGPHTQNKVWCQHCDFLNAPWSLHPRVFLPNP